MRDLASRLRDIVRRERMAAAPGDADRDGVAAGGLPVREAGGASAASTGAPRELVCVPDAGGTIDVRDEVAAGLGAVPLGRHGECLVIDRLYPVDRSHGRRRIEACRPSEDAPIQLFDRRLAGLSGWARRPVFFDIETTGISGGAGTLPFLVGCGWFEDEAFRVRQFFLTSPAAESAMLDALAAIFGQMSLLVTFNGRTFDVPMMEMRWAFHRSPTPTGELAHFDMLPPARRLWRRRESIGEDAGCSLGALERDVLGFHRIGDVPGLEIPSRYFHFLRSGDPAAIEGVLEHNRWDLVSLAAIMAHALWLVQEGPDACREPSEQLALGRLYAQHGDIEAARQAYEAGARGLDPGVRRQALAELARLLRRERRHDEAAVLWQRVLDLGAGRRDRGRLERQAAEALAIHHEHRRKDPATAQEFAEMLREDAAPAGADLRVRHRLARLKRKLDAKSPTRAWWTD